MKLLSRSVQKFTNVFSGSVGGTELNKEFGEVLTGELPFEGPRSGLPVILKIQKTFGDGIEIGKVVGCQNLPLDNREVDFDLVEPTGMDGGMHERQAGIKITEAFGGSVATMRRAVVHDPEDTTGVAIGWPCHHLFDQPVKGGDAVLTFAAAKDAGPVDIHESQLPTVERALLVAARRPNPSPWDGYLSAGMKQTAGGILGG